jgi:uncharacterized coiled-coil DUF342 family protein
MFLTVSRLSKSRERSCIDDGVLVRLRSELDIKEHNLKELNDKLSEYRSATGNLQASLDKISGEIDEKEQKIKELGEELNVDEERIYKLNEEIENLRVEKESNERQVRKLSDMLMMDESEKNRLVEEISRIKADDDMKISILKKENEGLHDEIRRLESMIDELSRGEGRILEKVDSCEEEKKKLMESVGRLKAKSKVLLDLGKLSDEQVGEVRGIERLVDGISYDTCILVRDFVGRMQSISDGYVRLVNLFEDVTGAVRVYVRVRGNVAVDRESEGRMKYEFDSGSRLLNEKYRVFGYFDESYTNEGVFLGDKSGKLCDEKSFKCKDEVYMRFDGLNSVRVTN